MAKKNSVRTSSDIAKVASKALRNPKSSSSVKAMAGSALSNRKQTSKK